ncbi:hypothetical protein AAMO2058_000830000 [Amorphochlora amoebiformis]
MIKIKMGSQRSVDPEHKSENRCAQSDSKMVIGNLDQETQRNQDSDPKLSISDHKLLSSAKNKSKLRSKLGIDDDDQLDDALKEVEYQKKSRQNTANNLKKMGRKAMQMFFGKSTNKAATMFGISKAMTNSELKCLKKAKFKNCKRKSDFFEYQETNADLMGLGVELDGKSSMDDILSTHIGIQYMKAFSEKERSTENVNFLVESHLLLKNSKRIINKLKQEVKLIYEKYIEPEAEKQVNLPAKLSTNMTEQLTEGNIVKILEAFEKCNESVNKMVSVDTLIRFKGDKLWEECRMKAKVAKLWKIDAVPLNIEIERGLLTGNSLDSSTQLSIKMTVRPNNGQTIVRTTNAVSVDKCLWGEKYTFQFIPLKGIIELELLLSGIMLGRTIGYAQIHLESFRGKVVQERNVPFFKDKDLNEKLGFIVDCELSIVKDFLEDIRNMAI